MSHSQSFANVESRISWGFDRCKEHSDCTRLMPLGTQNDLGSWETGKPAEFAVSAADPLPTVEKEREHV